MTSTSRGRIVASFGRRSLVDTAQGEVLSCVTRGRRTGIVCGDWVRFTRTTTGEGVVEDIEPRTSLIYRSDAKREKAIAANATQIAIVLAVAPIPNIDFLDRCIAAGEYAGIRILLVLNKIDLESDRGAAAAVVEKYRSMGYPAVSTSKHSPLDELRMSLRAQSSVFIGQSGVGKSTLVNRLVPEASARVGNTSTLRDVGRHTTTSTQLYKLDASSTIVDSPGMHAFGLSHIPAEALASCFVEVRSLLGQCRFSNCRHHGEPDCAVQDAARTGRIDGARLDSYRRILLENARNEAAG